MHRDVARTLTDTYVDSWLTRDIDLFLGTLHPGIVVREYHGPEYHGRDECRDWFSSWHADGGSVRTWAVTSHIYDDESQRAAIEWDFSCLADGDTHRFLGASLVHFAEDLIIELSEYGMRSERSRPMRRM